MGFDLVVLLAGLAVLILGAEGLVRGSSSLALRLGLPPLVIGLTIVAFGTSAPELVVSVDAALTSQGDIAVGNIVGSNIFNIGIILGLAALICPITVAASVIRIDAPVMIGVSLLGTWLIGRGVISRPAGLLLFCGLVVYIAVNIWLARRESGTDIAEEFAEGIPGQSASAVRDALFILGGLALLVAGSRLLVSSATELARHFGISEAVIGLTIVACGTSMPELATSVVAALRRQPDIAVGNVVGSNIFNILGILGVASMVRPLSAPAIEPRDLLVMLVFAVALLPLMWTGRKLIRLEGGALLVGYGIYLWALWPAH